MVNTVKNTLAQNSNGDNILDLNGTWKIDGVEVEATADEINTLHNPPSSEEIIFPNEDISTSKRITKININQKTADYSCQEQSPIPISKTKGESD